MTRKINISENLFQVIFRDVRVFRTPSVIL